MPFPFLRRMIPANPWFNFSAFLVSNLLLAYSTLSLGIKLWIGLFGIFLPFFLAFLGKTPILAGNPLLSLREPFQKRPPLFWFLLWIPIAGLALFVRFYHWEQLRGWPMPDEALYAFFSMDLAHRWHWQFFFSYCQLPPLTNWAQALLYKIIPPSLFSLWLFPILVSLATFLVASWGAFKVLPSSLALILSALVAFGFPFLYPAQFSMLPVTMLVFTTLTLVLLGLYLKESPGPLGKFWAFSLGTVTGLGFLAALDRKSTRLNSSH